MLVFKKCDGIEKIIARQMFSMESGRKMFNNGKENFKESIEECEYYPCYDDGKLKSIIKTNEGIVYLDKDHISLEDFGSALNKELSKLDKKYKDNTDNYVSTCVNSSEFTLYKRKPKEFDSLHARRIIIADTSLVDASVYLEYKFIWHILDIGILIRDIVLLDKHENKFNTPIMQLCSIFYDSRDILNVKHNKFLSTNISIRNFNISSRLIVFSDIKFKMTFKIGGNECPNCKKVFKKYAAIHQAWCRESADDLSCSKCGETFKTKVLLKKHEKSKTKPCKGKIIKSKESMEKDKFSEFYKNLKRIPEFHPQWNFGTHDLYESSIDFLLCPKRGGAFEIIKYYGNINLFQLNNCPIINPKIPIYKRKYEDLKISPSYKGSEYAHIPDISCTRCTAPLYGYIYVVSNGSLDSGYPICSVCGQCENYADIYSLTDVLFKVKYPRKVGDVIDKMEASGTRKRILKASFKKIRISATNHFISAILDKGRYIGWCGNIYDLIANDELYKEKESKYFNMKIIEP